MAWLRVDSYGIRDCVARKESHDVVTPRDPACLRLEAQRSS
jgi:hypothetical protein